MIIIGYPGIGKSTLAEEYDSADYASLKGVFPKSIIDLDSSIFHNEPVVTQNSCTIMLNGLESNDAWADQYCKVAESLSDQDHLVFVSSHEAVQKRLRKYAGPVGVICPSIKLKDKWLKKLRDRYTHQSTYAYGTKEENDKNFAAYNRACEHYEADIKALKSNGFELIEITSMSYDLKKLIFGEDLIPDGEETVES